MTFQDIERLLSPHRVAKYLRACRGNETKTLVLYRANLRLSYGLFSVASMFEVVLRNKIDEHYKSQFLASTGSSQWLDVQSEPGGCFYGDIRIRKTLENIVDAKRKLRANRMYTHDKLVAELTFGFWRNLFGSKEFRAAGSSLHQIFINRPYGTNHTDIFNKLASINGIRNRIAHHEPICFNPGGHISTVYASEHYNILLELFRWLDVDTVELLKKIDKVPKQIAFIDGM